MVDDKQTDRQKRLQRGKEVSKGDGQISRLPLFSSFLSSILLFSPLSSFASPVTRSVTGDPVNRRIHCQRTVERRGNRKSFDNLVSVCVQAVRQHKQRLLQHDCIFFYSSLQTKISAVQLMILTLEGKTRRVLKLR